MARAAPSPMALVTPAGDTEGSMSECLWYRLISANIVTIFPLSPAVDYTSPGKRPPSHLWPLSLHEKPLPSHHLSCLLLLLGSLLEFPLLAADICFHGTLVICYSTKPLQIQWLKTTILFRSQCLRLGIWERPGWMLSLGVPHVDAVDVICSYSHLRALLSGHSRWHPHAAGRLEAQAGLRPEPRAGLSAWLGILTAWHLSSK